MILHALSKSHAISSSSNNKADADEGTLAEHRAIVKSLHHAIHKRPRHNRAVQQAAQRMEQHLATTSLLPQPQEWTLYIAAWGAAGQPDKALEVLSRVEKEMVRTSDEKDAINPKAIYGAAVSACCQSARLVEAFQLLDRMRTIGYPPDVREWGAFLTALCSIPSKSLMAAPTSSADALASLSGDTDSDVVTLNKHTRLSA